LLYRSPRSFIIPTYSLSRSAFGHQLAQHRARYDDDYRTEHITDPFLYGLGDLRDFNAQQQACEDRYIRKAMKALN